MKVWVEHEWGNVFTNPPRSGSSSKILVADVHRAQQTNEVKKLLQKKKTLPINVPPGCTSRVRPLDVCQQALQKCSQDPISETPPGKPHYVRRRQDISVRASGTVDKMGWKCMG